MQKKHPCMITVDKKLFYILIFYYFILYIIFTFFFFYYLFNLQLDANKITSPTGQKNNKPKKLNNHRRIKKSPPWAIPMMRQQTVDDPTDLQVDNEAQTVNPSIPIEISGSRNLNIISQPNRSPGTQCAPTLPIPVNANMVPPPPNATIVVCVLAGTGRADLWVRNNRGQTPLDLCPADQPLRRALIKCCDAATRARNAQIGQARNSATSADANNPVISKQEPQLLLNIVTPKAPCQETYAQLPGLVPLAEYSKRLTTNINSESLDMQSNFTDSSFTTSIPPPQQQNIPLQEDSNNPFVSTNLVDINSDKYFDKLDIHESNDNNNKNRYIVISAVL